jgi:hypothetical protein
VEEFVEDHVKLLSCLWMFGKLVHAHSAIDGARELSHDGRETCPVVQETGQNPDASSVAVAVGDPKDHIEH